MQMTQRQEMILERFEQIETRTTLSGKQGYFLAGQDCTFTINLMIVSGRLRMSPDRQLTKRVRLAGIDGA